MITKQDLREVEEWASQQSEDFINPAYTKLASHLWKQDVAKCKDLELQLSIAHSRIQELREAINKLAMQPTTPTRAEIIKLLAL